MIQEKENSFELEVVSIRLKQEVPLYSETPLNTPWKVVEHLAKEVCDLDREVIYVINVNTQSMPINVSLVSIGTLCGALTTPREMLKASILSNASGIIILHNHPSGEVQPSEQDILLTRRMEKVCDFVGIELLDHIIVGRDGITYFSFCEKKMLDGERQDKNMAEEIIKAERMRMR